MSPTSDPKSLRVHFVAGVVHLREHASRAWATPAVFTGVVPGSALAPDVPRETASSPISNSIRKSVRL